MSASIGATGRPSTLSPRKPLFEYSIEGAAVESVGARLGDDVDRAAGELAIFDVERRELDLGFAHRVIGDRGRAARREAGVVEAVDVALRNAVDGEGVAAVVAAEAGDAVRARAAGRGVLAVEADARVDPDDVANVAVEGRRSLRTSVSNDVPGPTSSWVARARAAVTTIVPPIGLGRCRRQREGQLGRALQGGDDLLDRLALIAAGRRGDGVGTAGRQVLGAEQALRIGVILLRRAGPGVGDGDRARPAAGAPLRWSPGP